MSLGFFTHGVDHHKNVIPSIIAEDGFPLYETSEIAQVFSSFFKNLYTSQGVLNSSEYNHNFFPHTNTEFLTMQEQNALSAPISQEELYMALKDMPQDKAPGLDGFISEFYLFCWQVN